MIIIIKYYCIIISFEAIYLFIIKQIKHLKIKSLNVNIYTVNTPITRWVCTALYANHAIKSLDLNVQTRLIRSAFYGNHAIRKSKLLQILSFVHCYMQVKRQDKTR